MGIDPILKLGYEFLKNWLKWRGLRLQRLEGILRTEDSKGVQQYWKVTIGEDKLLRFIRPIKKSTIEVTA